MWLIKIKVYLHEVSVTLGDLGYDVHAIWPTWPQRPVFGIPIFWLWMYPMQVIPEARHADYIRRLRFYCYHWVDTSAGRLISSSAQ